MSTSEYKSQSYLAYMSGSTWVSMWLYLSGSKLDADKYAKSNSDTYTNLDCHRDTDGFTDQNFDLDTDRHGNQQPYLDADKYAKSDTDL